MVLQPAPRNGDGSAPGNGGNAHRVIQFRFTVNFVVSTGRDGEVLVDLQPPSLSERFPVPFPAEGATEDPTQTSPARTASTFEGDEANETEEPQLASTETQDAHFAFGEAQTEMKEAPATHEEAHLPESAFEETQIVLEGTQENQVAFDETQAEVAEMHVAVEETQVLDDSFEETQIVLEGTQENQVAFDETQAEVAEMHVAVEETQVLDDSFEETQIVLEGTQENQVAFDETQAEVAEMHVAVEETQVLDDSFEETQIVLEGTQENQVAFDETQAEVAEMHVAVEETQVLDDSFEETQIVLEGTQENQVAFDETQAEVAEMHVAVEETQVLDDSFEETQIVLEGTQENQVAFDETQAEVAEMHVAVEETQDLEESQAMLEEAQETQVVLEEAGMGGTHDVHSSESESDSSSNTASNLESHSEVIDVSDSDDEPPNLAVDGAPNVARLDDAPFVDDVVPETPPSTNSDISSTSPPLAPSQENALISPFRCSASPINLEDNNAQFRSRDEPRPDWRAKLREFERVAKRDGTSFFDCSLALADKNGHSFDDERLQVCFTKYFLYRRIMKGESFTKNPGIGNLENAWKLFCASPWTYVPHEGAYERRIEAVSQGVRPNLTPSKRKSLHGSDL